MKRLRFSCLAVSLTLLLGACATIPTGPSLMALPGSGKDFDQFRVDDGQCREYARQQIGGVSPNQTAVDSSVVSAAVGTAVGAAAGAALGGSRGAGVGAGTGLLVGSLAGTEAASLSGYEAQQRYDYAYVQCMYAKGNQVPVASPMTTRRQQGWRGGADSPRPAMPPPPPGRLPPQPDNIPPPPSGSPPGPPPDLR